MPVSPYTPTTVPRLVFPAVTIGLVTPKILGPRVMPTRLTVGSPPAPTMGICAWPFIGTLSKPVMPSAIRSPGMI